MPGKRIWLDCDPGHDDATAILLAIHSPGINLIGISTVHGNTDIDNTFKNALRCLYAFGAHPGILVYRGASQPLLKSAKHDPEIHGHDGLGGVEGLPSFDTFDFADNYKDDNEDRTNDKDLHVQAIRGRLQDSLEKGGRATEGMAKAVQNAIQEGEKLTIVSTGPMTNIALFVSVYPDLLDGVEEFVFMGGGVGQGNRSAVAEYNILCDPEAAQIVLNVPTKKTMIPINVTHTAIVTKSVHAALLDPSTKSPTTASSELHLPSPQTPLRHTLSTLLTFFSSTYASTFGFTSGPPLHDALTIFYLSHPQCFRVKRRRVDVELKGELTCGETVVDLFGYWKAGNKWGREGRNCLVAEWVDVEAFFKFFLECVERCDTVSPLNKQ
ncbi:uridine nucleosidase [Fomitiporia mediterranea MF3/22]|uniref:uridine nucleosidase n=1 Tax=Fomitiporia mediterranea (strain MF3/22) TaxID=694068 RepID=UPI00044077F2|nr:uridine nucleosidase [Fomitiporia mediterranea MF3/22]EJD01600.1 uridine nucleosidase [Fomitiporia mediterranea MF3/22]